MPHLDGSLFRFVCSRISSECNLRRTCRRLLVSCRFQFPFNRPFCSTAHVGISYFFTLVCFMTVFRPLARTAQSCRRQRDRGASCRLRRQQHAQGHRAAVCRRRQSAQEQTQASCVNSPGSELTIRLSLCSKLFLRLWDCSKLVMLLS